MSEELRAALRRYMTTEPSEHIKEIVAFMASVCQEKWIETDVHDPNKDKWSDRQSALEAIVQILSDDEV